jgi:type VI secretion system protein ImpH
MNAETVEKLKAEPWKFDFFRALRVLENERSDLPKIGESALPAEDAAQLTQKTEMGFASSTLGEFSQGPDDPRPKLSVRFFGLLGANGPMPLPHTMHAIERSQNEHDTTLVSFLNVFHHRMISFFYRAWAVCQKSADYDRPASSRFADYIGSFFGFGERALWNRDSVPDRAKLYYSGRLAFQARSAAGLEDILRDYFSLPATIQCFFGHWIRIPRELRTRLGVARDNGILGCSTILGGHQWDMQNRFRLRLGPMDFARFRDFIPGGASLQRLADWIGFYTGNQFFWDVQLVLKAGEVPGTVLGSESMLGRTSWLKSLPFTSDAGDLIIGNPGDSTPTTTPDTP